jgi:hypothetical protein
VAVVSTTHLFHYALAGADTLEDIVRDGLRPLSDFPESERWRQFEAEAPGFFERLYELIGRPVLRAPYANSGIFLTPVDFRALPGTLLHDRPRIAVPVERIEPAQAVLTWQLEERIVRPFGAPALAEAAALWDADLVREWFGRDRTRLFFHVPQVATYQGRVAVEGAEVERG